MNVARWIILLVASMALAQDGVPVFEKAGPNLLPCGDFENGALTKHWKVDRNQGGFSAQDAPGRTGGTAAKLVSTVTTQRGKLFATSQEIPVGSDVRVSVWARAEKHLGGTWAVLEGKGGREDQEFHIAGGTSGWTRYEFRTTIAPKDGKPGQSLPTELWFYVYGQGTVLLDDAEICVIQPDAAAEKAWLADRTRERAAQVKTWSNPKPAEVTANGSYDEFLRTCTTAVTKSPAWGLLATDGLRQVFRDRPFRGPFGNTVSIEMSRHEYEGAQVLIFAYDADLTDVKVDIAGLQGLNVEVLPVVYGDRSRAPKVPWYAGTGSDQWPDLLLPNRAFTVTKGTVQPVYLRIYCPADVAPGEKTGTVTIASSKGQAALPLHVKVHKSAMPKALTLKTMTVEGPDKKPFIDLALQQRMGIGNLYAGMTWTNPRLPAKGDSFDFSKVETDLQYAIDRGLNAFTMASTPKPGKWGFPKEYTPQWKAAISKVLREYGAWLKQKDWLDKAYFNNIDEPWDNLWVQVKEVYAVAKAANPEVNVFSCINKVGGLDALKNHADVFDVYIQQHYQQQGPAWQRDGKELWWAICIWPDERPNLFIECPLQDARIVGWLAFQQGVAGFEYWALSSWGDDWEKRGTKPPEDGKWLPAMGGVLTCAWPYDRNRAGDGYLTYPGPDGQPLNSLRFEALRDGLEDSELLVMLRAKLKSLPAADQAQAEKLLNGGDGLTTNAHVYSDDPERLLAARKRILELLDR